MARTPKIIQGRRPLQSIRSEAPDSRDGYVWLLEDVGEDLDAWENSQCLGVFRTLSTLLALFVAEHLDGEPEEGEGEWEQTAGVFVWDERYRARLVPLDVSSEYRS